MEKNYEIIKKYCPALRSNVIFKVSDSDADKGICINKDICERNGGCKNSYIKYTEYLRENNSFLS